MPPLTRSSSLNMGWHTTNPQRARIISVIAASVIALGCGTNYGYSAWAPQFAQRLKLSSTQINLIGTAGNLGMYATGIPVGMLIDARTPRWGVIIGALWFALGYYPIAKAYDAGPGVYGVGVLCLFSFFTGAGGAACFFACIKTSAINFPESRGTATAFPLACFGLSALFFSAIALALAHDTSTFLLLLATGTVLLPIISFPFLRIVPRNPYQHVSQNDSQLRSSMSSERGYRASYEEPGAPPVLPQDSSMDKKQAQVTVERQEAQSESETSSLLSRSPTPQHDGDIEDGKDVESDLNHEPPHLDIRGFKLLQLPEFWQLLCMLGLMTGVGLMTINNIGNNAQALWRHYDGTLDDKFIAQRQVMHVSILSFGSFCGRLLSGIGSDILVIKLNRSRFWCIFVAASIFAVAQIIGTQLTNPHFLILISGLTGLAYGMLFGVYPSLVAHAFGVNGLSQNWGTMCLAPVISGNIFNLLYGRIFDSRSVVRDDGDRECRLGKECYSSAYWVTFVASLASIAICLWSIYHENQVHRRSRKHEKGRREAHERTA